MSGCISGGLWVTRPPAPPAPHPRRWALQAICDQLRALPPGPAVDLAALLEAVCDTQPMPPGVIIRADLKSVLAAQGAAVRIAMATAELLRNAAGHAFPVGQPGPGALAGRVGLCLRPVHSLPGVAALVSVSDNGCGFGSEPPPGSRSGIAVARRMVRRCGGTLARTAGPGTMWHLAIPDRVAPPDCAAFGHAAPWERRPALHAATGAAQAFSSVHLLQPH